MTKILIVGCHPDDAIIGVGGTICKHIENGDSVFICVVTIASSPEWDDEYREIKIKEQQIVDKFLGITKRYQLNYPVLELNTISQARINKSIERVVREVNPDIVYTHYNKELNYQHNLVSIGTLVATRQPCKARLLMYETPSVRCGLGCFKPNYYVSITAEQLNKKIECFGLYPSEIKKYPHPRSEFGINNLSLVRGSDVGVDYAEGFVLVRKVVE